MLDLISKSTGGPAFIEFGLLHFKLLLNAPGEEAVVTIHLSRCPFRQGQNNRRSKRNKKDKWYKKTKMYKYDPVNTEWLDYSEYAEFSLIAKRSI
jgi:hypothetical protein